MKEVLLQKFMGRIEYSYKLTSYNSSIFRINRSDNLKSINRSFDSHFQIRRNFLCYFFSIRFTILEISYKTENSSFSLRNDFIPATSKKKNIKKMQVYVTDELLVRKHSYIFSCFSEFSSTLIPRVRCLNFINYAFNI